MWPLTFTKKKKKWSLCSSFLVRTSVFSRSTFFNNLWGVRARCHTVAQSKCSSWETICDCAHVVFIVHLCVDGKPLKINVAASFSPPAMRLWKCYRQAWRAMRVLGICVYKHTFMLDTTLNNLRELSIKISPSPTGRQLLVLSTGGQTEPGFAR